MLGLGAQRASPAGSLASRGSQQAPATATRRGSVRVSCQAFTVREQSPPGHRALPVARAVAAPERQALQDEQRPAAAAARAPPAGAANAILPGPPLSLPADWQRAQLERLMHREGQPAFEGPPAQQQQPEQQQAVEEEESYSPSTSGRSQQAAAQPSWRQQQQQQQEQVVLSTRRARPSGRARSPAAAPMSRSRAKANSAAVAAEELRSAATLRTWLLDCHTRQSRVSRRSLPAPALSTPAHQQMIAAGKAVAAQAAPAEVPARGRAGSATQRRVLRFGSRSRAAALQLDPQAMEGISQDTQADMLALLTSRLQLSQARRVRRKPGGGDGDMITWYMRALGNTVVLGRQQEAQLARILQKGRKLEALAVRIAADSGDARVAAALAAAEAAPAEEGLAGPGGNPVAAAAVAAVGLKKLAAAAGLASEADVAQVLANQREAKDLLMQYNVRLVINIAKRYANNGIELDDLIPEGMVGLSKSLDRFEPAKGFKFSTYAHWWIRQAISRAVCDQSRVVRLPSHVCELLYRINRAIGEKTDASDKEEGPSYEEIAAAVGLPVQRVIQYLRLARIGSANTGPTGSYLSGTSLKEVPLADLWQEGGEVDDLALGGGGEEEELEEAERAACMRAITDLMLGTLDKRERNILRMRYGLLNLRGGAGPSHDPYLASGPDGEPTFELPGPLVTDEGDNWGTTMSLGEVAVAYGLSKERIRQIEDKAMRALRKPWRMQLVRELSFGSSKVTPGSLSEYATAQQISAEEGLGLFYN